jgi:hypothetical protein
MHVAGILPETTGRGVGKQLYRLRPGETLFPADFLGRHRRSYAATPFPVGSGFGRVL